MANAYGDAAAALVALEQKVNHLLAGQQQLQQGMLQLQQGQQAQTQQIAQVQAGQQQILQQLAVLNPGAMARVVQDTLLARAANLVAKAAGVLVAVPCANGALPAAWPAAGATRAFITAGLPIAVVDALLGDYGLVVAGGAPARRLALLSHLGAAMRQ